jgi:hypothetical protein
MPTVPTVPNTLSQSPGSARSSGIGAGDGVSPLPSANHKVGGVAAKRRSIAPIKALIEKSENHLSLQ